MLSLDEISYSRDATVAAVRDYYYFLTRMYLKESDVIEPPEGGWPNLSANLQSLAKYKARGAPGCYFADWQKLGSSVGNGRTTGNIFRLISKGASIHEEVPPHVIGLTPGGRYNPVFLLDIKLCVVHWYECPGEIRYEPSREPIEDDPYDYVPQKEAEWRTEGQYWMIPDFFGALENQFRELRIIPTSLGTVLDVYTNGPGSDSMISMLQDIYREHGWPGLKRYHKKECPEAMQTALEERYLDYADRRDDE
ncbi:hypothetical protein F4814DRAFT_461062 [Daldinia grandis]|nr:hypothetical protein F4814DRAFT_461062 [Daldinia grandis]